MGEKEIEYNFGFFPAVKSEEDSKEESVLLDGLEWVRLLDFSVIALGADQISPWCQLSKIVDEPKTPREGRLILVGDVILVTIPGRLPTVLKRTSRNAKVIYGVCKNRNNHSW